MEEKQDIVWFAMRATYRRLMMAKRYLDEKMVENYVPMCSVVVVKNGRKTKELIPAISDLIFVHTTPQMLDTITSNVSYLIPIRDLTKPKKNPVVVKDRDMEQFIKITQNSAERIVYVNTESVNLSRGTKVRIIAGEFEGYEGILAKVKGIRDKRVTVTIAGVATVAMASISAEFIEVI